MFTRIWIMLILGFVLAGCTGIPQGLTPVSPFDAERYLGRWYEIARLDHSFERGLDYITADYSRREDGGIRVINRGWEVAEKRWREAEGKAYFIDEPTVGRLKVSFFGPFYGGYNVVWLDPDYQLAMVSGPDRSYFWLLSRTPTIPPERLAEAVERAADLGFETATLIYPRQEDRPPE